MYIYAKVLPGTKVSAVDPWLSWVVNVNVVTRLHEDGKDLGWCFDLVITDKNFVGGDLCFVQPGLAIPLLNGDFCIFPSKDITHFNLDYVGEHCSMVFATCSGFASWEEDQHGWYGHKYMV